MAEDSRVRSDVESELCQWRTVGFIACSSKFVKFSVRWKATPFDHTRLEQIVSGESSRCHLNSSAWLYCLDCKLEGQVLFCAMCHADRVMNALAFSDGDRLREKCLVVRPWKVSSRGYVPYETLRWAGGESPFCLTYRWLGQQRWRSPWIGQVRNSDFLSNVMQGSQQ
jgi:hypothetical protein